MMLSQNKNVLMLEGEWTIANTTAIEKAIGAVNFADFDLSQTIQVNGNAISKIDTSGAYWMSKFINQIEAKQSKVQLVSFNDHASALIDFISSRTENVTSEDAMPPPKDSLLVRLGKGAYDVKDQVHAFFDFIGHFSIVMGHSLMSPFKIRWKTLWANVQTGGVQALFIIGLLNFLIGIVIAYQGGTILKQYGANIFVVELISISMIRELAPLMTAIIVAGRTGSAIAAQIGTMVVNEEVDALQTIGINPLDQLVVPKALGLVIALPLLTVFADMCSVFGGMVLARDYLDISFAMFLDRIPQVMTVDTLFVGLAKTPVFALIIALTGCYQGFQVKGGADSVGRQTTVSVVQSIFLVIICDALFSILTKDIPL